jgi:hypothetical protein
VCVIDETPICIDGRKAVIRIVAAEHSADDSAVYPDDSGDCDAKHRPGSRIWLWAKSVLSALGPKLPFQ